MNIYVHLLKLKWRLNELIIVAGIKMEECSQLMNASASQ
jgi:hypothetical protein